MKSETYYLVSLITVCTFFPGLIIAGALNSWWGLIEVPFIIIISPAFLVLGDRAARRERAAEAAAVLRRLGVQ